MTVSSPAGFIVDGAGTTGEVSRQAVEERLRAGAFFWLDFAQPVATDFEMLRDVFGFHALALEDSDHFGQRPKLDEYDDYAFLVVYGANRDEDELVEVHCFTSAKFLVTIHGDEAPAFDRVRERLPAQQARADQGALLLYEVVDGLVDSFFPVLADLDERIDTLEDAIFKRPDDAQLQEIFAMKRRLVEFRKVITPQRDLFARLATSASPLPGMSPETERYYRDVYDHLIRISDLVDSYRDLMTGSMDVYLSTVSNRLNDVMKQLTIIATIFMPLAWLTGFFGQNFGFMVLHISGWTRFLALGVVPELAAVIAMLYVFRRRGWV
jgi:magnesium transporter